MHRYIGQKLVSTDIVKIAVIGRYIGASLVIILKIVRKQPLSVPIYIANEKRTGKRNKFMLCVSA